MNPSVPEPHGLERWLEDGSVELDEELNLADHAILASISRAEALERLRMQHHELFEQAIRDCDEKRLSRIAAWMDRDALCLDEMAKIRRATVRWEWPNFGDALDDLLGLRNLRHDPGKPLPPFPNDVPF